MKIDVIVGGLYGDEGKGKIVSYLGSKYDYIFRVNASTNASHTVHLKENDKPMVTKQLPSVFHQSGKEFVVGPGAILNLKELQLELEERPDLEMLKEHVKIASSITILLELYVERNKTSEFAQKYGSTNQGTGNAVIARTSRHCVRLYDIMNVVEGRVSKDDLFQKIKDSIISLDPIFASKKTDKDYYEEVEKLLKAYQKIEAMVGKFSVDYTNYLAHINQNANILVEGCNGIMLDNLHGLNPYTTSSSTSINALLNGANLSPYDLSKTFVIITGYFCCLNKRPFPTELSREEALKIYELHEEIDDAEKMQRRLGWFDLPTLRKILVGHKNATLVMNKVDVMIGLDEVKICDYYIMPNGEKLYYMPDNLELVTLATPHYHIMKGWKNLENIKSYHDLPQELKDYLNYIEQEIKMPITYVGTGRGTKNLIKKEENYA